MNREIINRIKEIPLTDLLAEEAKKSRSKNTFHCFAHDDNHPSLTVSLTKNLFYCHGCGIGGDIISLAQLRFKLTFVQAVAYLSERYNIPYEDKKALSPEQLSRLKKEAQERREKIAWLNEDEQSQKVLENAVFNYIRECRNGLPHYRKDVVFLDPKIYTRSLLDEEEIDGHFDTLDEITRQRQKYFQEERNAVYRS